MVPDRIELVPEQRRVVEALGGQCGIWGALFIAVACLVTAAALFTAIGTIGLVRDQVGAIDHVIILLLGLTSGLSLAAAARTCFFFSHLRAPIKGNRWLVEETVLVPSRRLKELFP